MIVGQVNLDEREYRRGERVIRGGYDIESPVRPVHRRIVNGWEVWDVVDKSGRFCFSGRTEAVNAFVYRWSR